MVTAHDEVESRPLTGWGNVSRTVEIKLLGTFEVVLDGQPVTSDTWPRRQAATLVKVLALSPGRHLPSRSS